MSQNSQLPKRDKSAYRPIPKRVVFRRDLETGKWAWIKNRLFFPIQTHAQALYRKLEGYRQTHPQYYVRTAFAAVISALIIIPAIGIIQHDPAIKAKVIRGIDSLTQNKVLTLAAVTGRSTVYDEDGLMHGFGYDVARQYASHLGVELRVIKFDDANAVLSAMHSGDVDLALLSQSNIVSEQSAKLPISPLACSDSERAIFAGAGIDADLVFVSQADSDIVSNVTQFLCDDEFQEDLSYLAKFHDDTLLDNAYNAQHFADAIQKLPLYEYGFRLSAKEFNHDWQLLAMIGYQESHLNANAVSPTGVQGIMMLTQDTAKAMGVKNRNDAAQSIRGGAKYLSQLQSQFQDIPEVDRLWFVLAAYNMGPNAVRQIQSRLSESGKDPNLWLNFYAYLHKNAAKNSRYRQCITYVTNIRTYLEAIKKHNANA